MGYFDEIEARLAKRQRTAKRIRRKALSEVGRAIVAVSEIENWVAHIYHDHCAIATSLSMPMFYEQNGIEKRIKLTNMIMEMTAEKPHLERWHKIILGLEKPKLVRNFVAHYGIYVDAYGDEPVVYLQPPELKYGRDGKRSGASIAMPAVTAAADALEGIRDELEKFWSDLQDFWYPDQEVEDEEED
jgi:hypothetical protein